MKKQKAVIFFAAIITSCFICIAELKADNTNTAKLKEQLQNAMEKTIKETKCKGIVALVRTPNFYWIGAAGDSGNGRLQTKDMFRLASMTKTFVSVVVLKLCEEGKLKLNDKISKYLPERTNKNIPYASNITVRQLLDMTSGIVSYTELDDYNDAVEDKPYRIPWTPEDILEYVYWANKADFAPGKGWNYSNTNYILLEMIVEQAGGDSLAGEMRRIIFTPQGLKNIFMEIKESRKGGFGGLQVKGFDEDGKDITEIQDGLGLADGGLISNANDVAEFLDSLFIERELLNESSLKQMMKFHPKENYGLGLELRRTEYGEAYGHSGGSFGFESDMLYFPKRKIIFVVLTNQEDKNVGDIIFQKIMNLLLNKNCKSQTSHNKKSKKQMSSNL